MKNSKISEPKITQKTNAVIVTAGLSDYKLSTKLMGLVHNNDIKKIYLVRKYPVVDLHEKLININPGSKFVRWLPLFEIWRFYKLFQLAKKYDVAAVIGIQLVLHGVQASLCSVLTNKPAILSVIGDDVHKHLLTPFVSLFLKPFVRQMKCVTVMGNKSKSIISSIGVPKERIVIIQNYQDHNKFFNRGMSKKWDIIFVGDLISRKCVHDLLEALRMCQKNYKLLIVGDGPQKRKLEKITIELELNDNVEFIGKVSNVDYYLNQSKIMVLPSKLEALPAVSIEAMYCGTPSILTNICDIPTYFENEKGCLLFTVGDIEALRRHITNMLEDDEFFRHVSSFCAPWAEQHKNNWSLERQVGAWKEILCQASF